MKKIALLMLLICAVMMNGCDFGGKEPAKPVEPPKQEIKQQSFIVYRAAADGREKLLPEKFTINDNGKSVAENALIALVSTKPQDASMEDVFPIGTKVLSLKVDEKGTEAAAVTMAAVKECALADTPPRIEFNVDRPFVYTIEKNGTLLFLGVMNDLA